MLVDVTRANALAVLREPRQTRGALLGTVSVRMNQDATAFAYTYDRKTSDLYLVDGLK